MPDLQNIIEFGAANPWLYLPAAVLLGALHALEPGHSKSLMAAFIIAIRGTAFQGVILGLSAAIGHTIIVWALALAGFWLGDRMILDQAEPWLLIVSGILIIGLALRLAGFTLGAMAQGEAHGHGHEHDHGDGHSHAHEPQDAHAAGHGREVAEKYAGRRDVTSGEIAWFGFTGGLLPCPAAIAVLIVCLQLQRYGLGIAMVGAFSAGLAIPWSRLAWQRPGARAMQRTGCPDSALSQNACRCFRPC